MRRIASPFVFLVAAGLLAGCPDRSISRVDPQQGRVEAKAVPVKINRDVDLLFVIDDSPSMADKQTNLARNFSRFIEVLSSIEGGLPNIHIAVVTSDYGTKGALDAQPGPGVAPGVGGCSGLGKNGVMQLQGVTTNGERFLSDIQPADQSQPRIRNYTGSLESNFARMAQVGAEGCGVEQHLEAMRQALQPGKLENAGFLREDALLAVIFIADEDDCSMARSDLLYAQTDDPAKPLSFRCTRFGITCDVGGRDLDEINQVGIKSQCHPNEGSPYFTQIADYVAFLHDLKKGKREKIVVASIIGLDLETGGIPFAVELREVQNAPMNSTKYPQLFRSCSYTNAAGDLERADPPVRLKAFTDQFINNTSVSICQPDLSSGLQQIAELLKAVIIDPCINGKLADADPGPDTVFDCSVSQVSPGNPEKILPRCAPDSADATNKPCWRIELDPERCCDPARGDDDPCNTRPPHALKIERSPDEEQSLPVDTNVVANCVTEVITP